MINMKMKKKKFENVKKRGGQRTDKKVDADNTGAKNKWKCKESTM